MITTHHTTGCGDGQYYGNGDGAEWHDNAQEFDPHRSDCRLPDPTRAIEPYRDGFPDPNGDGSTVRRHIGGVLVSSDPFELLNYIAP